MKNRSIAAATVFAAFGLAALAPLAAAAQGAPPSYAVPAPPPPGPPPSYASGPRQEQIRGTIIGFQGKYAISLRDERGYVDNITMHQGTVINPTGFPLQAGMRVQVYGSPAGPTFAANEIDTHVPVAVIAPPPVSFGFGFGFGRRW